MSKTEQVLIRTDTQFADELREGAARMSRIDGRKVSIAEYLKRSLTTGRVGDDLASFGALFAKLKAAAEAVMPESRADALWLDLSVTGNAPKLVVEGDADFLVERGLSVVQFAKLQKAFTESLGFAVVVDSEPRKSWQSEDDVDAYVASRVEIWRR